MPRYYNAIGNPELYSAIGDPGIHPSIGDPGIHPIYSKLVVAPAERFRFMAWNGTAMQAVSNWAPSGQRLCADAIALGVKMPVLTLHLVSSTRGWFNLGGTGVEWFNFLGCQNLGPWKTHFLGYKGL